MRKTTLSTMVAALILVAQASVGASHELAIGTPEDVIPAGTYHSEGDLVIDRDIRVVPDGSSMPTLLYTATGVLRIESVIDGRSAQGAPGAVGLTIILRASEIVIGPDAQLLAGNGGEGREGEWDSLGVLRAGAGGDGGSIVLVAQKVNVAGKLLAGEGGEGGDAMATGGVAIAGPGGKGGVVLLVIDGVASIVGGGDGGDGGNAIVEPPRTGVPALPNTGDGGDGASDTAIGTNGAPGADGEDAGGSVVYCDNGGEGARGGDGSSATATAADGGASTWGNGGDGGSATAQGGSGGAGGAGGDGGWSVVGGNCKGGNGGAGGNGGGAVTNPGNGGDSVCASGGAAGGTSTVSGAGGPGGPGGAGTPSGVKGADGVAPAPVPGKAKAGAGLGLPAELCEAGSGNGVDLCELLNRPGLYMPGNLVTEAIGDIIPGYPDCLPIGGDD